MVKRGAESAGRPGRPKKSRISDSTTVVAALAQAEALPADLRSVFEVALPSVLAVNKADRHAYEVEIVEQAEKSIADVQAALEKSYEEALAKQEEVIAPAEHARRKSALAEANEGLEAAKAKLDEKKEAQVAAKKSVQEASSVLKAAEKDAAKTEKEMQALADKKAALSSALENEFLMLRDAASTTPEGKKALQKMQAIGKQYSLDDTLMGTLPPTCKKDPANRSEFETLMFNQLKGAIEKEIEKLTTDLAALEPTKAEKVGVVATAKEAVEKVDVTLSAANEELSAAQAANKEAAKEVSKADDYLYQIWGDMKVACDLQDELRASVKNFKETVLTAFQALKEQQPEQAVEEEEADHVFEGEDVEAAAEEAEAPAEAAQ